MKKTLLGILTATACTVGAMSAPLALSPPLNECEQDADCATDAICHTRTDCVEWPEPGNEECFTYNVCADPEDLCGDEVCGGGQVCLYGPSCEACNDVIPLGCADEPQVCGDQTCAPGEICTYESSCDDCDDAIPTCSARPEPPPLLTCYSDSDCGSGEFCDIPDVACECFFEDTDGDGVEEEICPPCARPEGFCQTEHTDYECRSDSDCGPNGACVEWEACSDCAFIDEDNDGENDYPCDSSCFTGSSCEYRGGEECGSDADCGPGGQCISTPDICPGCACLDEDGDGVCENECPPCESNAYCEYTGGGDCSDDDECGPGERCEARDYSCPPCIDGECDPCDPAFGTCVPDREPGEACFSDRECGAGEYCQLPKEHCSYGDPNDPSAPVCDALPVGACAIEPIGDCRADSDCAAGEVCFEETVCPECPFEDIDGDGQSDIACAAVCEVYSSCQPSGEWGECATNADCASDEYCGTLDDGTTACLDRAVDPDVDPEGTEDIPFWLCSSSSRHGNPGAPGLAFFALIGLGFAIRRKRRA